MAARTVAAEIWDSLNRSIGATFPDTIRFRSLWLIAYLAVDAALCRVALGWANTLPGEQLLWAHNGLYVVRAAAALFVLRGRRLSYLLRNPARELRWAGTIAAVGAMLCTLVLALVVAAGSHDGVVYETYGFMNRWMLFADLLASIVLAPMTEELIDRGVLVLALPARVPGWAAVLLSGVVFGAMHAFAYRQPGLPLFPLLGGMFTATAMLARRSLWGPVVVHAAGNAFLIAAELATGSLVG